MEKLKIKLQALESKDFVAFKLKMYSFLLDNTRYRTSKGRNRNDDATIVYKKCKDVLLKDKCMKNHINRTQRRNYKIENY